MKRTVLVLLFLSVCSLPSFSQRSPLSKIEIGLEGGPNFTAIYGASEITDFYTIGFGFCSGVSFQANFSSLLSLRTNLSFERKVQQVKGDLIFTDDLGKEIGPGRVHSNLDYLIIPVLIRFNFGNHVRFYANIGPYLGFLLQAKTVINIPEQQKITDTKEGGQIDFGISAGLGMAIPIQDKFSLTFEARNNLGLLPVFKGGKLKTNAIDFLVGFAFLIPNHK